MNPALRSRHRWLWLLAALVLVAGSAVGRVMPAPAEPAITVTRVAEASWSGAPEDLVFALVVGTDFRPGVGGHRADAIHLVAVDPKREVGTILNIPRDTWVRIPGRGAGKINSAMTFGGPELMAATVEGLTGIAPHFVISTDFAGFQGMVDELGGVTVDVPVPMNDRASGAVFEGGPHHMNGFAALAFSRNRHLAGGDFTRSANQAHLILASLAELRKQGTGAADAARYLGVLVRRARIDGVSIPELYRLGRLALSLEPAAIRNITMPGVIGSAGGASVVHPAALAPEIFADVAADGTLDHY